MPRRHTTPVGTCGHASGEHEIIDAPAIDNKGYRSPVAPGFTSYLSQGVTSYRPNSTTRLCREHYLAAYAEVYPDEPVPVLAQGDDVIGHRRG